MASPVFCWVVFETNSNRFKNLNDCEEHRKLNTVVLYMF
jgi:hypothetical protein